MQVTCPGCSLNYAAMAPDARCPACGANAPAGGYAPQGVYGAAPYAGQGFGQGQREVPRELAISSSLIVFSIIVAIFCQPAGIISFVLQDQAKTAYRQGQVDVAEKKIANARLSLWIGGGLAAFLIFAYIIFIVGVVLFAAQHTPQTH